MTMRSKTYWEGRFARLEKESTDMSLEKLKEIEKVYAKAIRDVEKDLTYWYSRFANDNGLSLADAKKVLDKGELNAFKLSVEEYIKHGESLDPAWRKTLEQASVRVHVTRLEAIKLQMQQHAEECAAQMAMNFEDYATSTYANQYYRTAFEIQKGLGVGWEFKRIDKDLIKKVISKPWAPDGKNFSARVWGNRTKLVNELHNTLTSALARGQSPDKTIKELSTKMESSKFNAGRVVMTESAFLRSAAGEKALKDLDVEQYQILATLDRKTSYVCREMDGKVFDMNDYKVGVTAPPFHPFCRTTTVPYFDDEVGLRASRDDKGKYKLVPQNMTYKEWEKAFVDGKGIETLPPAPPVEKKSFVEKINDIKARLANETDPIKQEVIIKEAGAAFIDEINQNGMWDKIQAVDDGVKAKLQEFKEYDGIILKLPHAERDYGKRNRLLNEYQEAFDTSYHKTSDVVKAELRKIRPLGLGNIDDKKILKKSSSVARPLIKDALDCYPTEWLQQHADNATPLIAKVVNRGYFNEYERVIAISGVDKSGFERSAFSCAVHELGHNMEHVVKGILSHEKSFYERRTAGEALMKLGGNYKSSEVTRKDHFLDPYMGKDYGGRAYELVSMGFEYAFTDPKTLIQDEDFAQFIFGLLTIR